MLTYIIIAILFVITAFLAFVEDYLKELHKIVILTGYAFFMVFLATTKSIDNTADALAYESMFLNNNDTLTEIATEPTYIYLSRIILAFGGTISVLFGIYALITIPQKLRALYHMTPFIFTALMIYIPVYFEIHDMVQIRSAAAATFLLSSLQPLADRHYLKTGLLMIIAILFHYSAVAFLPFLFIGNRKISKTTRWIITAVIPICFVMYLTKKDLFSLIPSSLTAGKLDLYQKTSEKGEWGEIAILYKNIFFISKCLLLYLCLFFYDYIVERNRFAPILINLFAASIIFLLTMATIPVLASRVSDLYGIVDCLVFTFFLYLIEPKYLARIGVFVVGLYMLIYNMLFAEYFT